jgi:hypothetical protein
MVDAMPQLSRATPFRKREKNGKSAPNVNGASTWRSAPASEIMTYGTSQHRDHRAR